jgi:hypothetical protein
MRSPVTAGDAAPPGELTMTKRLVVCCDGTWNNPQQEDNGLPAPTNVFKLFNALAGQGPAATPHDTGQPLNQLKFYHPGVGAEGGVLRPLLGGAIGAGISRHICSAYQWLAHHYREGDDIYLYGFSRGALAARSLGGFLSYGLLNLQGLSSVQAWARVHRAYQEGYRQRNRLAALQPSWQLYNQGDATPIRFIGVWDTVGALGVPDDFELLNLFDNPSAWSFHDTSLGAHVRSARHAMAIDEIRSSFCVTHWNNKHSHPDVKERWFPGVHADVGGGYANCGLSDGALQWMIEESQDAELAFQPHALAALAPNPCGALHTSYKGAFSKLRSRPRNIPALQQPSAAFHPSAHTRQQKPPITHPAYYPTLVLAQQGAQHPFDVFAQQQWNYSGLYLEAGVEYRFEAEGEWLDHKDKCDWQGMHNQRLTFGDVARNAAGLLGKGELFYKKLTGNQATDLNWTKRVEEARWLCLIGAISNDSGDPRAVANDGSPVPHQYEQLFRFNEQSLILQHPGYLYCFANDAWSFYGNNAGTLQVTVTRIS